MAIETKLPFEKETREILIRKESKTSESYGSYPDKRSVEDLINFGIVNLDKPSGPTSHQVSAYVQKILKVKKSGHSGTLDPAVTGVLPVALGRGTKIVQLLLLAGKEYVALMHLHKKTEDYKIYQVFSEFIGKIKQLPPVKSAVKRQWRERKIYYTEILAIKDQEVLFRVGCEAGTYIRKLIHDIGQKLGCGAHMAELRRTKVAAFNEDEDLVTLQDIADAYHFWKNDNDDSYIRKTILPIEYGIKHVPKIWVFDSTIESLCHGMNLAVPGISKLESGIEPDQLVAVLSLKGELIAYGRSKMNSDKIVKSEKGIAVKTEKVFMLPGTYPSQKEML
ncbi:MAG: RNA-guided pseudouridylation complex pseudouridine synthase subunit Cbf5 [Candidatus Woesearchaeota archaeon]